MTITQRLQQLDDSLVLHNEGEWNSTTLPYSAFNSGGVESEVGEFLYGLVRMMKPQNVLETGTHLAVGAAYMGLALQDNGFGHLDTIEFQIDNHFQANKRISTMGLQSYVTVHFGDVAKFDPVSTSKYNSSKTYQFIFLDTEPQTRFAELEQFYPFLDEGGYMFIHDLHPHMHQIANADHGFAWPYGPITDWMKRHVANDKLRPFHFKTPRGLTGFYKTGSETYRW